jgi:hypothetical protein
MQEVLLIRDLPPTSAAEPWDTFGPRPLEDFEICPTRSQCGTSEPFPVVLPTGPLLSVLVVTEDHRYACQM